MPERRPRLPTALFAPPPFDDHGERRLASVLRGTLGINLAAIAFFGSLHHFQHGAGDDGGLALVAVIIAQAVALSLVWKGHVKLGGSMATAVQLIGGAATTLLLPGASGPASVFVAVMMGGQVFGAVGALVTGAIGIAFFAGVDLMGLLDSHGPGQQTGWAVISQLITTVAIVAYSGRSMGSLLAHLKHEQQELRRANNSLARRVADEGALADMGRLLVESDDVEGSFSPALEMLAKTWGQPMALFVRGDGKPRAMVSPGLRVPVLVGGDDEASRVVAEENVTKIAIVDGARTLNARAMAVRTGTVPHGVLAAVVDDTTERPGEEVDPVLVGAAALLGAAFEWQLASGRLRAAERRRAAMVKSSPDGLIIVDASGAIIDANPSAVRLLRMSREDRAPEAIIGRTLGTLEVFGADDLSRITTALYDVRDGRPVEPLAVTLKTGQRDVTFVEMGVVYALEDERGRFDVTFRDVTARVEADRQRERLEGQLYAARRLEALGQLAGGVAHDFNNLLSVILTNARLLKERDDLDDLAKEDLTEIVDCGRRAADLTSQLLTFARQQRREPRVLEINGAIRGVEKLLRRLMPANINLELELTEDPWPVIVDPAQLEQVLVNLVANARDAMPDGGVCAVSTRNAYVTGHEEHIPADPGRYVELVVTDTGTGMDAETQAHVFEPFFTTKPLGRGSGLGLATVYGIVKQSGGAISVESHQGRGSTFRVWIPYADVVGESEATPAAGDALSLGRERILVVDDDQAVRRATERALVSRGFSVLVANNAEEALSFSGQTFDAVVVDLVMPGLAGDSLVERLRERRGVLPAVLLTGYGRRTVEMARPFRLLRKPASPEELARSLRAVIDEAAIATTRR